MDGGQTNVFVGTAVTCHKVLVEQFVVKSTGGQCGFTAVNHAVVVQVVDDAVGVGCQRHTARAHWRGRVGNVV